MMKKILSTALLILALCMAQAPAWGVGEPLKFTGPMDMTLTEGYAATYTGAYTVTGVPPLKVEKTSGNAAITWNDATKTLDIAAGLAVGTYTAVLTASNGIAQKATLTFTLTVKDKPALANAPAITGPTAMTLAEGYAATSTGAYTVTGAPAPTVTKTSGNAAITWNDAAKTLDIAAGLAAGKYTVVLTAANGIAPDATLTFTLTVNPAGGGKKGFGGCDAGVGILGLLTLAWGLLGRKK